MTHATAFVLAGGQSSRMRSDKALLRCGGRTLLQRTLAIARETCERVMICGPRERYGAFGKVVEDLDPGHGPLSGIQAALHTTQTDLNFIVSVDLPLMQATFVKWLLERARSGEQMIMVPEVLGRLQPLCAVYRKELCPLVDEALAQKRYKVTALFYRAATNIIPESEIRAAGFDPVIFANVNTPEEYETVLQERVVELAIQKSRRE